MLFFEKKFFEGAGMLWFGKATANQINGYEISFLLLSRIYQESLTLRKLMKFSEIGFLNFLFA